MSKLEIVCGLCEGRHEIHGVSKYIFPQTVENPMDFPALEKQAAKFFRDYGAGQRVDYTHVILYVTGLTPCLIAAVNVCLRIGVQSALRLTLMHYDRATGDYMPQDVADAVQASATVDLAYID